MTLNRSITIDRFDRREEGAYGLLVEYQGQAPLLLEAEGCDSSYASVLNRVQKLHSPPLRWCIVRLVPVEGNELLLLDFERLQSFSKKEPTNDF